MTTGWNFHELYLWHDTGSAATFFPAGLTIEPGEHAENAATKRRFRNLVEVSGLLDRLTPIPSLALDEEDLALFHTRAYIERIKALSADRGGDASYLTPFGPGSYDIALLAAGGTTALIDAVARERVKNGYALVRPPGHHAERDKGLGFCLFANVPIAVMKARAAHKIGRIAIVDWDVHHGNGTQQAFYEDPDTLVISLHQDGLFPRDGRGGRAARGEGRRVSISTRRCLPAAARAPISRPSSVWSFRSCTHSGPS
jgi:acetoin utilization deacetylase AcuC-like enzyme